MKGDTSLRINWVTTSVLIFYPLLLIIAAIIYCDRYGTGWFEWGMAIAAHYVYNISVGIGLHRLWAHSAYKTNKFVEFILMIISSGTLQGPAIAWASDHALHHTYMDEELDPHSPLKFKNKLKGFLWSHIGWMLFEDISKKHIDKGTMRRLGRSRILVFQLRHYWKLALGMNLVVPFIVGYLIGGDLKSAVAAYIFIGLGRAFQQQMTFCVNSLTHVIGSQPYLNGTPGEIPWMFFLLLGENWHNYHHAFARDYRNGWKWHQLDIHKWIIYLMSKVGLAHDLVVTPKERILAKQAEAKLELTELMKDKLSSIEIGAIGIADMARQQIRNLEKGANMIADSIKVKLVNLEEAAENLLHSIRGKMQNCSFKSQEKVVKAALKKLEELEVVAYKLGLSKAS
ncbi:MAG: Fatty-acid desaturase [Candidatus Midichloria mitochondrii]|uniref:Acyl-CoA desaturase n=1 Tax=Midichloria mitochondrii (strain IricVA) TaxID=696127 RepID=F7XVL3_MIDMI|nr:fatty acid desaturase [Candidatus Midichloria mitochondrii]AEI88712.1 acyl-CoA desaturase [Candidatus Midichloria mitochondrii IricVA]MDJ1256167.1 fatty acid desaturase [Candidatus Midichloria mitochondrii]MDJ1287886.1 fatty acid desaturase [Candidatus Midichloria mitochondrii]MDJ1298720.1 fatty acid desaturase [Candidatus Midichloria mitochondrii]MDJ1583451.1 fatty acid desaturase [Candidatus Midichloria mitochondrii]